MSNVLRDVMDIRSLLMLADRCTDARLYFLYFCSFAARMAGATMRVTSTCNTAAAGTARKAPAIPSRVPPTTVARMISRKLSSTRWPR